MRFKEGFLFLEGGRRLNKVDRGKLTEAQGWQSDLKEKGCLCRILDSTQIKTAHVSRNVELRFISTLNSNNLMSALPISSLKFYQFRQES